MKQVQKSNKPKFIFAPKKELGQNFLFSEKYLQEIAASTNSQAENVIIEIGSGYGTLTSQLAKLPCQKVISLEKDPQLFACLQVQADSRINFLNQDVLEVDWKKLVQPYSKQPIIITGNLPYYLANDLIITLLFQKELFSNFTFLVQKEVGEKWTASPKINSDKYSATSVFINFLANSEFLFVVPKEAFQPAPKVDGAVVRLILKKNCPLSNEELKKFLQFLKNCFRFRRKTLLNNLFSFSGNKKDKWIEYFESKNYSLKIRPQNLSCQEYYQLFIHQKSENVNNISTS